MNDFLRIHIRGWTASFRYPGMMFQYQPTLPVPPLSTIYGLISAAKGEPVKPDQLSIGYVFLSNGKAIDLESIYETKKQDINKNVVKREILFEPELFLYINDLSFKEYFLKPHYPLLLGRSTELAMVCDIKEIQMEKESNILIGGSIFEFNDPNIYGMIHALPKYITPDIPRKTEGVGQYCLVDTDFSGKDRSKKPIRTSIPYFYDREKEWGIAFHGG
ncbi:MAG: type I-B CRISPR-associated protein Cas5b [Melioribacteraceae bacterium]|nr:type I-B CRISPR-associated protein Cas5b [Melioribacteraceae bacterium]